MSDKKSITTGKITKRQRYDETGAGDVTAAINKCLIGSESFNQTGHK